jgi:2-polyprenyl-6-hydroxyphenyl methylase/3-demethylubiquinone-9 3-methyltransferase
VLDANYLTKLGQFDIVYSWGVLHHTGKMYEAFRNVAIPVKPGGLLFISIYNDQGLLSLYWKVVKRAYNTGRFGQVFMTLIHLPYVGARFVWRKITRRPIERGMSLWTDYIDWLGGYPFEVAKPGDVVEFFAGLGLSALKINRVGRRSGNNEFVFQKESRSA